MRWSCLVLALMLACSDASRPSSPPPSPPPSLAGSAAPDAALAPFTVADAVRLFEAVAACKLEPHGLDHLCPERNALDHAYGMDLDPQLTRYQTVKAAARAVIGHASPAVRTRAFDELDGDQDQALLVRALGAEPDATALRAMIFVAHTGNAAILDAVLAHVAHPDPEVRLAAMRAVATEYHAEHPGIFEAISRRIGDDADPAVRADACVRLGLLQDPRAVAVFDRMLVAATPPALFDACGAGLVYAWLGDPEKEHPVEAAYRRTLALLRSGPHRAGAPGPHTLDAVSGVVRAHRTFGALPRWVDVAEVRAALATFAAARRADEAASDRATELLEEIDADAAGDAAE